MPDLSQPRRIAFYAPLKPPNHPTPSGDRQMARNLIAALEAGGHSVDLASEMRAFLRDPEDTSAHHAILQAAEAERDRIAREWAAKGPPDLWVCYHPYHKSPDLLGPALCAAHGVPWLTIEASYSKRRGIGHWADFRDRALDSVRGAALNIALTDRDARGLSAIAPKAPIARMVPFFDAGPFLSVAPRPQPNALVTVAMMRPGDKTESYRFLAKALKQVCDHPWTLSVLGDGPARPEIEASFSSLPDHRIQWIGAQSASDVRRHLACASLYVWPGFGEAFGLAYLEAQAASLPVVALKTAGVPEVVRDGETGWLGTCEDDAGFARKVIELLDDDAKRGELARNARNHVAQTHDLKPAAARLEALLNQYVWTEQ